MPISMRRDSSHRILKVALPLLCALLLFSNGAGAQSFWDKINIFKSSKKAEAQNIATTYIPPKTFIQNATYVNATGMTLDNIWNDIWWGSNFIPPLPELPDNFNSKESEGCFNLAEYTRQLLRERLRAGEFVYGLSGADSEEYDDDEEEEDDDFYTETPEEYSIWSNHTINPYNVKLSDMKDTVRIDVSSYVTPGYKYVTSEFGSRWGRLHAGIDLKLYTGDTIYCAFDKGVVRIRRYEARGYGHFLVIRHANGLETLYGHMSKPLVDVGDTLRAGEPIGLGGNTGRSFGSHLHFELRYLGNPINPRDAIDFNTHKIHDKTLTLTKANFRYQNIDHSKSRKRSRSAARYGKSAKSTTTKKNTKGSAIIVRKGDNLGAIARRNGTTVAKLKKLNGLKNNNIRAGQKLRVR